MAEKKALIVIKKITVVSGGAHGGAWKVAFADFMTAMMAFFLVMWLLAQTEETKKNVADYFATPSVIEYQFSNYGVELTLEKLFLDLINEPLKFFQAFITPVDHTPNIMGMGSTKVVLHHLAEEMGDAAQEVDINRDQLSFTIPEEHLFMPGTAKPNSQFVPIMEKLKGITAGLEDSNVYVDSFISTDSVPDKNVSTARNVGEQRLDLVSLRIQKGFENPSVEIFGKLEMEKAIGGKPKGRIRITIKQKELKADGSKPREMVGDLFGNVNHDMNVYDNFVHQLTNKKPSRYGRRSQAIIDSMEESGAAKALETGKSLPPSDGEEKKEF